MPTEYDPTNFWKVLFTRMRDSALPRTLPRSIFCLLPAILASFLEHFDFLGDEPVGHDKWGFSGAIVTLPFGLLLSLLLSFRTSDSYKKWETACGACLEIQAGSDRAMSRLCSFVTEPKKKAEAVQPAASIPSILSREVLLAPTESKAIKTFGQLSRPILTPMQIQMWRFRRLLVLSAVTIKMHVRNEKEFTKSDIEDGLVEADEIAIMQANKRQLIGASYSIRDGKQDRFPSKNRPGYVFLLLHALLADMYRDGLIMTPNHHLAVDNEVVKVQEAFETIERIGMTIIPLPYAQVIRIAMIIYLSTLPFALVRELGWITLLISGLANVVYFTVDECAGEMATPFGCDANDVDIEKHVRRLDKHTASMLSVYLRAPVENFDLFPDTRKTNADQSLRLHTRGSTVYDSGSPSTSKKRSVHLATSERRFSCFLKNRMSIRSTPNA